MLGRKSPELAWDAFPALGPMGLGAGSGRRWRRRLGPEIPGGLLPWEDPGALRAESASEGSTRADPMAKERVHGERDAGRLPCPAHCKNLEA
jgi:hypothetical protein